jgi:pyridoxamine 5'-phosphate oxidase family protein
MINNERVEGGAKAFTEAQAQFLAENFIGRLATSSASGQPHVVPVAYRFDGSTIAFSGRNLTSSLKFRQMMANNKVAFVVDDVVSHNPWRVRGVEVRGRAEPVDADGVTTVRIIPLNIRSWGLTG